MKGGARRKTISSDYPPPQPHTVQNDINDDGDGQVQYDHQHREEERHQQRAMNDVSDGGNEYDEEENEAYEDGDQEGHGGDAEEGENNGDEEGPPTLAEGFYVIEAIRKKRIRKGQTQYLIKWHDWPESANTWEPVENLMSCPDVIDAFEESLRSGKQRSNRKRKHKNSVAPTPQPKKKMQQSKQHSPADTYHVPSVKLRIIERPSPDPSVDNSNSGNGSENHVEDMSNSRKSVQLNDAKPLMHSPQIGESIEKNASDVEPTEPKVPHSMNQENKSDFAIHIQEELGTEGVSPVEVRPSSGILEVDGTEHTRISSRIGSKRRKSFAVKRFKQESNPASTNEDDDATTKTTMDDEKFGQSEMNNVGPAGNGFDPSNIPDASQNAPVITNIIKPVNYSTSIINDTVNVSVSFLARRSDGEEVVVDNKYLKENNPILLINFYEQHLRYNNPSE